MLSYQHEYHAGNHADILKHICLTAILSSLCKKDKPFTVIDSHAGAGRFSLDDERLLKTGEAQEGIERLMQRIEIQETALPEPVARYIALQRPYFKKRLYAGSPELERLCSREQDHIFLVEKHPQAIEQLKANVSLPVLTEEAVSPSDGQHRGVRYTVLNEDSYKALTALTPPTVKRGLVIIDPSFEDAEDYKRVARAVETVHRKWNTAIIAVWYPLLVRRKNETAQMLTSLETTAKLGLHPCDCKRFELEVKAAETMTQEDGAHLYGSGIFVMNQPWQLEEQMSESVNYLKEILL